MLELTTIALRAEELLNALLKGETIFTCSQLWEQACAFRKLNEVEGFRAIERVLVTQRDAEESWEMDDPQAEQEAYYASFLEAAEEAKEVLGNLIGS